MVQRVLSFIIFAAFAFSGCAVHTAPSGSGDSVVDFQAPLKTLPNSYGPIEMTEERMKPLESVCQSFKKLEISPRFSIPELRALARETHVSPVSISRCNVRVLKVLVATDWTPIAVLRSPVGPGRTCWAVIGYNESDEELILTDPINRGRTTRMKYPKVLNQRIFLRTESGRNAHQDCGKTISGKTEHAR
jgi:hypothetical protein